MNQEKFWVVWRDGGCWPKKRHDTKESADAEAARLASENVGGILHCVLHCSFSWDHPWV